MKRIFIVGSPRSGTTLLQSMLYAGGDVYSMPETHYFRLGLGKKKFLSKLMAVYFRSKFIKGFSLKIFAIFSEKVFVKKIIENIDHQARLANKCIWLEKTPDHLYFCHTIKKYCNDSFFIYIERSDENIVASMIDMWVKDSKNKNKLQNFISHISNIKHAILTTNSFSEFSILKYSPWIFRAISELNKAKLYHLKNEDLFITISYENLIINPEFELQKLCKNSGLKYSKNMLEYEKKSKDLISKKETWKENNFSKISSFRVNKYMNLSDMEKKVISKYL